ncbi:hypothetical protein Tco_1186308 [Tanacetum coccineum]
MTCIHGLHLDWFHQSEKYAFQFLFGEKFNSFKNIFDHNIDQLKKQLEKEELHECDSKECLAVLKKQFEIFFDPKSPLSYSYQYQSNLARQKETFQEYAHYDTESLKKTILSYQNSIEKRIDERACHEEELRIKERNVKERRNKVKWLNEIELQKQESMMNVGTILNDSLDVLNSRVKSAIQGKIQMLQVQRSIRMAQIIISPLTIFSRKDKMRYTGLGYKGPCVLSQANAKNPKLYNAYELYDENAQLHVFDSEETLEDAEESHPNDKEFPTREKKDINKMMDVFDSMESDIDKTLKQNEHLKNRLLEATLAKDVKNLVITSCVEIRNKKLQDEH